MMTIQTGRPMRSEGRWAGLLSVCAALVCALGLALGTSLAQAEEAWQPVQKGQGREGVNTWVRSVEGMPVKAFKGATDAPYTVPAVLALLADSNNFTAWVFNCKHAQHPANLSSAHNYIQFKGIWPASDRDVLVRTSLKQLADQTVVTETRQVDGHPEQAGHVRITYLNNQFRLTPLADGWTHIEFETQVQLGGLVPSWLANLVSTQAPKVTLEGMHRQLKLPKYSNATLASLPDHFLKAGTLSLPPSHLKASSGAKP